ncbi:uncharacterized protein LOC114973889 [Acropora millepora]|uniref:uncharacterized protein LOC114973889 n=1 Tax=Acropora millepora TaxID=45264 RepID=UPI001CF12FE5|nr:uncharacterized protein LOC114973889 [Acropora millepora]
MVSWISLDKTAGQCNPVENSISGMYLRSHTFKTIQVGSLFECQTKCEEETHCQSYNVIIGKNICELNSRTKEARPQDFVPDWNRCYMTQPLRATLGSIQTLPAKSCQEIKDNEGIVLADTKYWIYSGDKDDHVILAHCKDAWQKVNSEPVCFGARGNSYGVFKITKTGRVKTMKLVHRSGYLSCCPSCSNSFWGCGSSLYSKDGLMTLITDTNRNILLPSKDYLIISHSVYAKHSYQFPGTHHKSPELVFRDPLLTLSRNQELWIWYGQDYAGYSESNNVGKTCTDVYALYV